jgi:hypothetical protein
VTVTQTQTFLLALGVGSALIAFWLVVRFPSRAPADFRKALIHVGAAFAVGWFAPDVFGAFVTHGLAVAITAIFLIIFPVLVYAFLASAWFLRVAHDAFAGYR